MGGRGAASRKGKAKTASASTSRGSEWYRSHEYFKDEWVDRPETLSGWADMGRAYKVLEELEERGLSTEELKDTLSRMDDIEIGDISRLKNDRSIYNKVEDAIRRHNERWIENDKEGFIDALVDNQKNGKARTEMLNITKAEFKSADAAKRWYLKYSKYLHPDNNVGNPKAEIAFRILGAHYSDMRRR